MSTPTPPVPQDRPEAKAVFNPPWEDTDVQNLRDYINRNPRFLPYLASRAPKIEGTRMEAAALSGARHAGFEMLFGVLTSMSAQANPGEKSPFIGNEEE